MLLRQLFDNTSSTYTYIIADENTREAAIIDPVLDKLDMYIQLLEQLDLQLIIGLDTHTHADHITALGELRDITGCTTYAGEQSQVMCASASINDGSILSVGSINIKAIYTPGHTDDSYTFFIDSDDNCSETPMLFTGDTLLIRGSGRTDFQSGSAHDQYNSIFNKLLTLPAHTRVYPGHDYKGWMMSTIAEETAHNPRLQVTSAKEYAQIMNNLNLADPALMDIAVPANLKCGKVSQSDNK